VDERSARTRATYDAIAPRFLENTRDRSVVADFLDRFAASLPKGASVLDVGAGPGCDSAELRSRGLRPFSLDLSLGMLRLGARTFPGPRVQSDVRCLPFADSSLQGVWANASLLHLSPSSVDVALREIHRVLVSSGLLHVSVKQGSRAGWESEPYGQPRWFQYWSAEALDAALVRAGFRVTGAWETETPRNTWLVRLATRGV
jgi:ubiquinone/menaquinone biosynthesis C-methylase UbiE